MRISLNKLQVLKMVVPLKTHQPQTPGRFHFHTLDPQQQHCLARFSLLVVAQVLEGDGMMSVQRSLSD
ncbi:unnamed protein product [Acanthoscelides obtectus]|uniref:Uncharacterized protein n=1 Tax=Acanthoscelides obtectus TaxID=200917 RepID=A0A9P0M323_ACAOB|nr:unnamed protein product [Acanthoscelides obtectus]CAK1626970.1 hypothetical protein AOBTE_LOCUS4182 [Acanthoscelides obtectus]